MSLDYLHEHPEFAELIRAVAEEKRITPSLIEKDYWIMHCLFGLQKQGYRFELKGGTSLSKGFCIIHRFSEDIDIRINPDDGLVFTGKNQNKPQHCISRREFYDRLAREINIPGISESVRDTVFDDEKYRSGGVRLRYNGHNTQSTGLKEGILLEIGFDTVTPNQAITISSWALDFALFQGLEVLDNKAIDVACYHPGYTLVEKLQTIATKFRNQQASGEMPLNFMRHYYDVFCLLDNNIVQGFIASEAYRAHKKARFPAKDQEIPILENEAFLLSDKTTRALYRQSYERTSALYYQGQPDFEELLERIKKCLPEL